MPIAEAHSAYVLDDRASPAMRSIREEAEKTTVALTSAGEALDQLGDKEDVRRINALGARIRKLANTDAPAMRRGVVREFRHMEGEIRATTLRAEGRVESLARKMDELGARHVAPTVELDGIVAARAQLALLNRELSAFGGRSATARVGASGSIGGIGGASSRGGAVPVRRSEAVRSVGVGGLNLSSGGGLAVAGAALPLARAGLGAGGAVLSSLGGAALGAGAIGAAGAGVAGVGIGGIMSIVKPASQSLKDLAKAQQAYTEAVRQYGRASDQAAAAKTKLNMAEASAPAGGAELLQQQRGLGRDWKRMTKPGQAAIFGGASAALGNVRSVAPTLSGFSNQIGKASGGALDDFSRFATSPGQMQTIGALAHEFARDIPIAERTAEHLVGTFGNIARAALPFFHDGVEFLERWTHDWEIGTSDISHTRRQIGSFVDDLDNVVDVAGSAAKLTRDLFAPGRTAGRGMLGDLGDQLDKWDAWAKRNPGKLREFFHDGVTQTEKIASATGAIVKDLGQLAELLGPVVGRLADLATTMGGAGLLLPTALRMGVGKAMGGGKGGGGGGGGGGALVPLGMGGGGAAAGAGAGAAAGGGIGVGGAAAGAGVGYLAARGGGVAGRFSAGSYVARPEMFAQRYGAVEGARYAMPASQLGARAYGVGRVTTAASRAAGAARVGGMAAARFALPVALLAGGLNAATLSGRGNAQRLQAFGSTLSMGNIPQPLTGAQLDENVNRYVQRFSGKLRPGAGPKSVEQNVATLEQGKRTLRGTDYDFGSNGEREQHINEATKEFDRQIAEQQGLGVEQKRSSRQRLNVSSRMRGASLSDSFQQSYGIQRGGGIGRKEAFGGVLDDTVDKMRKMRPAGAKILGESMIAWAKAMGDKAPELQGQVDRFVGRIEKRFSKLGKHVEVVNGRILTGSSAEWAGIEKAISTPAELARQKVTDAFTAIQREAAGSLRAMGYSNAEANSLIRAQEKGGKKGFVNTQSGISASHGDTGASRAAGPAGDGIGDGPGDMASNGARSGRTPSGSPAGASGAGLMGASADLGRYASLGREFGNSVTSGLRPGAITKSGNVSFHSSGHAIDMAGGDMMGLAKALASKYGSGLEELIFSPLGWGIKNGQKVPISTFGAAVVADHYDHVHVADKDPSGGGGVGDMAGGGFAGGGGQSIELTGPKSGVRGVSGALADRASSSYAAALEKKLNDAIGGGGVGGGDMPTGGDARAIGRRMLGQFGFGADQWDPLNRLWTKESGWNPNAVNPSSGAMGIPQALGHGNVFALGDAPAQIKWGLNYIKDRYGTPAAAWAHSQATNWYGAAGGFPEGADLSVKRPTMIGVGDTSGGETVSVRKRYTGPKRAAGRRGGRGGGGGVVIESITVNVQGGVGGMGEKLKAAVRREVDAAFHELADEFEMGIAEDEGAVIG